VLDALAAAERAGPLPFGDPSSPRSSGPFRDRLEQIPGGAGDVAEAIGVPGAAQSVAGGLATD
jgi:hypothetical protein